nr:MAG TPA: hypothetical protein [Caudoviricetes sp.]
MLRLSFLFTLSNHASQKRSFISFSVLQIYVIFMY